MQKKIGVNMKIVIEKHIFATVNSHNKNVRSFVKNFIESRFKGLSRFFCLTKSSQFNFAWFAFAHLVIIIYTNGQNTAKYK